MDLDAFLKHGTIVPNPNYKKPSKKNPAGSPKFITSSDYNTALDYASSLGQHLASNSYDLSQYNEGLEGYETHNVRINPINTEEELNRERANNQGWLEQAGHSLTQAVGNEVILGTGLGLSNMVDFIANIGKSDGEDDYTNPVSTWIEEQQDKIKKEFEIYRKDPNATWALSDFGWWADNAVSIASTASMLIPSTLTTKALSWIGKGLGAWKLARGTAKAINAVKYGVGLGNDAEKATNFVGRLAEGWGKSSGRLTQSIRTGTEIATAATLSRTMENYMEARQTYKETYDMALHNFNSMDDNQKDIFFKNNPNLIGKSEDEIAKYIANNSADEVFRNDYAMLLFDIAQFKAIGSLWKGIAKKEANAATRIANRNAIRSLTKDGEKQLEKTGFLANQKEKLRYFAKHPLSSAAAIEWTEGIEEGFQGIQQEKGKESAQRYLDATTGLRSLGSYLTDSSIWEQAFWGVVGGVAFQHIGSGLGNMYNKASDMWDKKHMSEQEYALKHLTEEKQRQNEIKSRKIALDDYVSKMNNLSNGLAADDFVRDPITGEKKYIKGSAGNRSISEKEAEITKQELTDEFITNMTLNATDIGNYELLRDYVGNKAFDKYFEEAGITFDNTDKKVSQRMLEKMDLVHETYSNALNDIYSSADVTTPYVANKMGRYITRLKLTNSNLTDNLNSTIAYINEHSEDATSDAAYEEHAKALYIKKALNEIDSNLIELREKLNDGKITKAAFEQYQKDYNTRRKQLLEFAANNTAFGSSEIKDTLSKIAKGSDVSGLLNDYNNFLNDYNFNVPAGYTPKADVKKNIDKKIDIEDSILFNEALIPKTDSEFQTMYEEFGMTQDAYVRAKYEDASDRINSYIEQAEDIDKAIDDIIKGNVSESLQKDIELLKLGHYSTREFAQKINDLVDKVKKERAKREEQANNTSEDGNRTNDESRRSTNEQVIQEAENARQQEEVVQPSLSTGETTESTTSETTETATTEETISASEAAAFKEDEEKLDKVQEAALRQQAAVAADNISDLLNNNIDILRAVTLQIWQENKQIYYNIVNEGVDGPAYKQLKDIVINKLEENGIPSGQAITLARDCIKGQLSLIASNMRRLDGEKEISRKFKTLIGEIANGFTVDEMNAVTHTIADDEFADYIEQMFDEFININQIITVNGVKPIINMKAFMLNIINDLSIDNYQAFMLLRNINNYLNSNYSKYQFTGLDIINKYINNPQEFFRELYDAGSITSPVEDYLHVSTTSVARRGKDYQKAIDSLRKDSSVTFQIGDYHQKNQRILSIDIVKDGVPIGYIAPVRYDTNGNGFYRDNQYGGISYHVWHDTTNDVYYSNIDDFIENLLTSKDANYQKLFKTFIEYRNANREKTPITDELRKNIIEFINSDIIQDLIKQGIFVLPHKYNAKLKTLVPVYNPTSTNDNYKFENGKFILDNLFNILAYKDGREDNELDTIAYIQAYYEQWKTKIYKNSEDTYKIQTALEDSKNNNEPITVQGNVRGLNDGKLIITDKNTDVSDSSLGLTYEENPIFIVNQDKDSGAFAQLEDGTRVENPAHFSVGSMGFVVRRNKQAPMVALFTDSNNISASPQLELAVRAELTNILTKFNAGEMSFDEVKNKLVHLFSGPCYGSDNLFKGYSVINVNNEMIALNIGGIKSQNKDKSNFNLIIYRNKKGSTETGTGMTYIPEGNRKKLKTFTGKDENVAKKQIPAIVNEIVKNLKFNATFYAMKHKEDTDESVDRSPYFYKKDGMLHINIGGFKSSYANFGAMILDNNMFKTNSNVNSNGSFFESTGDNMGKSNSMYVEVTTTKQSETRELESNINKSVAETIEEHENNPGSTEELLETAGLTRQEIDILIGKNTGIPIVSPEYYYNPKAKEYEAAYNKRTKRITFSPLGVKSSNNDNHTLKRLLIHEQLHARFNELGTFDKEYLVDELLDCYNELIRNIEEDLNNDNLSADRKAEAQIIKDWLTNNKFNVNDYFTNNKGKMHAKYANLSQEQRNAIFAEEFIVECLTQDTLLRYINKVNYRGLNIGVETNNANKSLLQKIVDILVKLLTGNLGNIKENTILAREYQLLADSNIIKHEDLLQQQNENETAVDDIQNVEEENEDNTEDNEDNEYQDDTNDDTENTNAEENISDTEEEFDDFDIENSEDFDDLELAKTSTIETTQVLTAPNGKKSNLTVEQYKQVRTPEFKAWFGDWETAYKTGDYSNCSKVIDENGEPKVVYHGSKATFNVFNNSEIGLFFSSNQEVADFYADKSKLDKANKDKSVIQDFIDKINTYGENKALEMINEDEVEDALKYDKNGNNLLDIANRNLQAIDSLLNNNQNKVYHCFIKMINPKIVDAEGAYASNIRINGEQTNPDSIAIKAKEDGHDGVIINNVVEYADKAITANNYQPFTNTQVKSATDNNGNFSSENTDIRYSSTSTIQTYNETIVDDYMEDNTLNTAGVIRVNNMNEFLDTFPQTIRLKIASMMSEGNLNYMCR